MKKKIKVNKNHMLVGGALVCSFIGGIITQCVRDSKKQVKAPDTKKQTPVEPVVKEVVKPVEVKVVERPNMEGVYEGTWEVKSQDPEFDAVLQKAKELFDDIEVQSNENSGNQSAGEIALSMLIGIFQWSDDIDRCKDEVIDIAKTALEIDSIETANEKTHRWSVTQHLIDKNRDKLLNICKEMVALSETTIEKEVTNEE